MKKVKTIENPLAVNLICGIRCNLEIKRFCNWRSFIASNMSKKRKVGKSINSGYNVIARGRTIGTVKLFDVEQTYCHLVFTRMDKWDERCDLLAVNNTRTFIFREEKAVISVIRFNLF